MKGKHLVLDMYECNATKINDPIFVDSVLTEASNKARSTLLNLKLHLFEPQGITGFALLAQSHISFHSWPETGYVAVDIYTCGQDTDPVEAVSYIIDQFQAERYSVNTLSRYSPGSLVNVSNLAAV